MVIALLLVCAGSVCGQDVAADMRLIQAKELHDKDASSEFKGVLKFYHNNITDQILNDCIYEHSCSEFSQHSFDTYGFFKGLMMTCDRLTRCNRTTLAETSPLRLTKTGKIKEHWDEYKKQH